jgi:aryl-alcohol dehydrogenase-like predicted oxidoreductase
MCIFFLSTGLLSFVVLALNAQAKIEPTAFCEASDAMMNATAHTVTTLGGLQMPRLIYGTAWKKDATTELVTKAVLAGFHGIDTACQPKHYQEPLVGRALAQLHQNHGIPREDLFLQTKFTSLDGQDPNNIPYDPNAALPDQVCKKCGNCY